VEDAGPSLSITLPDKSVARWTLAQLRSVKGIDLKDKDGQTRQDAWSLRDLLKSLHSKDLRVVRIEGEGGSAVTIDQASWLDQSRVPVLRTNRHGLFKFEWVGPVAAANKQEGRVREVIAIKLEESAS